MVLIDGRDTFFSCTDLTFCEVQRNCNLVAAKASKIVGMSEFILQLSDLKFRECRSFFSRFTGNCVSTVGSIWNFGLLSDCCLILIFRIYLRPNFLLQLALTRSHLPSSNYDQHLWLVLRHQTIADSKKLSAAGVDIDDGDWAWMVAALAVKKLATTWVIRTMMAERIHEIRFRCRCYNHREAAGLRWNCDSLI